MTRPLTGSRRRTYDAIFRHPVAHNLHWRDVWSMLRAFADSADQDNGHLKITRNGHTLVLRPSREKDLAEISEVMQIRRFIARSNPAATALSDSGPNVLVVLDHRQARIYKAEGHGAVPERLTPYDPLGEGRHLHYVENDSNGQRRPEDSGFYQAIATRLRGAEKILMFGSGTGASSAMNRLLDELEQHHAGLADRVVGTIVVDQQHMTDDQLLARAREYYRALDSIALKEKPPIG